MTEFYLPRNHETSCVVIQTRAAEAVDETLVKMLTSTSAVQVGGQYIVGQEPFYSDPVTRRLVAWPGPRQFMLLDLQPEVRRDATSLRWQEGHAGHPAVLQAGFAALTLCEQAYDRFIDVPVVPELGFFATER